MCIFCSKMHTPQELCALGPQGGHTKWHKSKWSKNSLLGGIYSMPKCQNAKRPHGDLRSKITRNKKCWEFNSRVNLFLLQIQNPKFSKTPNFGVPLGQQDGLRSKTWHSIKCSWNLILGKVNFLPKSTRPQSDLGSKHCITSNVLKIWFREVLFYLKMSNSKKILPWYFGPYLKIQNLASYFSGPRSEVSKNVCHIPVGEKLREEIDFLETGCFWPAAVPWRQADLRPPPKMSLYRVTLVLKILSFHSFKSYSTNSDIHTDRQMHTLSSIYRW